MKKLSIVILVLLLCSSCCYVTDLEREAHYVNGDRYIPMLKGYIENDENLDPRLKETYYMSLNAWWELIKEGRDSDE